jgi:hypothetical protein
MRTLRLGWREVLRRHDATPAADSRSRKWARRLGAGAFLFFLIKGLLWLAVPTALVVWSRLHDDRTEVRDDR